MLSGHFQRLTSRLKAGATPNALLACSLSSNSVSEDWSDLSTVLTELRNISRAHRLEGKMPNTKLLKELGYGSLVIAIRKKHGGVVETASKMGTPKNPEVQEVHKKVRARAKRRQKRHQRLNMHDFY